MVTKAKYTYEDYLNTPEGERYELLDGELVLVASPNEEHQLASVKLVSLMYPYATRRDLGWVFHAPFDIVFSDSEVVQPDIMFISKEREHIRTAANVRGAPDLVVEILSPSSSRRDWKYKRGLYAKYGVREYWIVDPTNRIVSVMLLRDGVLEIAGAYVEGDTLESVALVGFRVGVEEIFQGRADERRVGHQTGKCVQNREEERPSALYAGGLCRGYGRQSASRRRVS